MKAILEFDLDEETDKERHLRCILSDSLALAAWEYRQWLWNEIDRHDREDLVPIHGKFIEMLERRGIDIESLIT